MKLAGHAEVSLALARVRKLHALGRIGRKDKEFIEMHLQTAIARIDTMRETDEAGNEVGVG